MVTCVWVLSASSTVKQSHEQCAKPRKMLLITRILIYIRRRSFYPPRPDMQSDPAKPSLLQTLVRHYDELVDQIRHRFGDRGFAREVVHDVCVQLLEKPDKDGIRTPLALLRKISHDQALSLYRREHRRQGWVVALPELPDVACAAPQPARHYEAGRELERLCEAITQLPARCQMVFVMHKIHGVPQADVATRMGVSLKTVEKHLRLGMAACRAHLERPVEAECVQ